VSIDPPPPISSPSQREGEDLEGREGEDGRKFPPPSMSSPLSKGRGGFGESPVYILPLPEGGGGLRRGRG